MDWTEQDLKSQFDRARAAGWLPFFAASAERHNFKPEELLGIASRETNLRDIAGDFHDGKPRGFSLMQIDIGTDPDFCRAWRPNFAVDKSIERGAQILAAKRDFLASHNVTAPAYYYAAYNCGEGNVLKALRENKDPDEFTTGKDYGRDVCLRASEFAKFLGAG